MSAPMLRRGHCPPSVAGSGGGGAGGCTFIPPHKAQSEGGGLLLSRRLPPAWRGEQLGVLLSCAVDALEVAFTMVDMAAADQPMVWLSRGFERITGYSRAGAAGRNCRFLQAEASDPRAVAALRDAISAGRHVRVFLWQCGASDAATARRRATFEGYWSFLALHPVYSEGDGALRYYHGVQLALSAAEMRAATQLQAACATVTLGSSASPPTSRSRHAGNQRAEHPSDSAFRPGSTASRRR